MRYNKLLVTAIFIWCTLNVSGQFYNGHQTTFGKNKVQYYDYYWMYYRFENFDCYFNEQGRELAQYAANYAKKKIDEIESFFDYNFEKRLTFIIFNKDAEYKQSNIGLLTMEKSSYNTGGFSKLINNKVMLYYETDHIKFQKQIASAIAETLVNEILYDVERRDIVSSSEIDMPAWYLNGLMRYLAFDWDSETENIVKDGITSGRYKKLNHLESDDAVYAGQSFWRFIGKNYGDALIPNIIYITKIYKKIDRGFLYVTGKELKELLKEWKDYYLNEYSSDNGLPNKDANTVVRGKKEQIFQSVKVSPDGKYIAYVSNDWGKRKIWLYNRDTKKQKCIFNIEPKLEQEIDKTYPVIAWHPSGSILTFNNEQKGGNVLYFYNVEEDKKEKRNLLYFDKILDFSYSPDGSRIIMSAVKDGCTDLFIHTIASATNEQITNDVADDLNPSFLKGTQNSIIFSSNRLSDTLINIKNPFDKLSPTFDVFIYDIRKDDKILTRLTEGQYINRFSPSGSKTKINYIGDANGIYNRYEATFDSTISYIDTTMHYRYFMNSQPLTNYDRNISCYSSSSNDDFTGEITLDRGRNLLRLLNRDVNRKISAKDLVSTNFRHETTERMHKADSVEQLRQWLLAENKKRIDTLSKPLYEYYATDDSIDIRHYVFEKEKQNYYDQLWRKDYMDIDLDTSKLVFPHARIYEPAFYNNYLSTQIDFSFLNNSYQVYTGGAPYFNPGINLMTRIGTIDLFEDYRITGGFRFSGDFDSNEYLFSVENMKGKFDKQLIFHRQSYFQTNETAYYKTTSNNLYLTLTKPINPAFAIKGTFGYLNDRQVPVSYNMESLKEKTASRHWATMKGEIVFDNTRFRTTNIYYGTRFKIFGEFYKEMTSKKSDMLVVGIDFRKYIKIHRELIWANRFAASTSFGNTHLLYYLGGVDNALSSLFGTGSYFDKSVPVNTNVNYGFQATATNLRGFKQNIRNGTSFALLNSEIRWPVIRYFAGHPLKSDFLNSLQIVGFADIGAAWCGLTPWSGENAYDTETHKNGPVTVIVDSNRDPIVAGIGAGLRAQLAGYFIRADWAWGIDSYYLQPCVFCLSFSHDF